MLMNRPLVDLIRGSNPDTMVMHDWWASLAAAAFGTIEFVEKSPVLYRQHGGNALGAPGWNAARVLHRTLAVLRGESTSCGLRACAIQAQAFIDRYASRMCAAQLSSAAAASKLRTQSRLTRGYSMLRHRLLRGGILRNSARLLLGDV